MFQAPLCPSSGAREYYTDGRCLWYLVLWFSSCRYGVELKAPHHTDNLITKAPNTTGSDHLYNTLELLMMGIVLPQTSWACNKICNKYNLLHLVGILFPQNILIVVVGFLFWHCFGKVMTNCLFWSIDQQKFQIPTVLVDRMNLRHIWELKDGGGVVSSSKCEQTSLNPFVNTCMIDRCFVQVSYLQVCW